MRSHHRGGRPVRTWALIVLLVSPTAVSASVAPPHEPVTFRIGVTSGIDSVNPLWMSWSPVGSWLQDLTYDTLLSASSEQPTPELADRWEVSQDGLTWTFHLRDGLRWSDGVPLTAHDVVWTANLMMGKGMVSDGTFDTTSSVVAPDDRTVEWTTDRPTAVLATSGYAALILPEHVYGDMDGTAVGRADNYPDPVTSGPFTIRSWDPDGGWTLDARPDHWGEEPSVDRIQVEVYRSDVELANGLRAGEVDYARFSRAGPWVPRDGDGLVTSSALWGDQFGLWFNLSTDGPTASSAAVRDLAVRRAIFAAVDRLALSDEVFDGYAEPDTSVAFAPFWRSVQPPAFSASSVEDAERGLEAAGYRDTNGDGIREEPSGGAPLQLTFPVDASDPVQVEAAPLIAASLARAGIGLRPEYLSSDAYFNTVAYQGASFDLFMNQDYGGVASSDPGIRLKEFISGPCQPWSSCFSDARYDALYEQQAAETDRDARHALVLQMQQILARQLPVVVLADPANLETWRTGRWDGLMRADPASRGPVLIGGDYSPGNALAVMSIRPADRGVHAAALWALIVVLLLGAGAVGGALLHRATRPRAHETPEAEAGP